ncbi:ABC transporter ATP-binding protein [Amorphus orientalis]|uniref:Branched-chain amino acid transport system ATP-binding protein n=1 Tax=Amorphus orientalis TaxID=649198 RepID=A0AAE3VQQ7_9HYPH|nr:ABC transporter ATP-binding protein [Amorphus orientalis]MDQ0316959.1 branched-chain amino acid transport system ATP-binding protein [Amorphus orientalis]
MALLEATDVTGGYGGADILSGLNLSLTEKEIVVIVGPNGAGKSTFMKAVFGLVTIRAGSIVFAGTDITNKKPEDIVSRGICYVPQERNVFPSMTVQENLEMGAFIRTDDWRPQMETIYELFPRLAERKRQPVGQMSGGERQMVAMGRALMLEPKLLLLDEPTAGLSPKFIDETFRQVKRVNDFGVGILMVEQNAKQALAIADRGYVFASGQNRFEDTGQGLLNNKEIAEMFLGG